MVAVSGAFIDKSSYRIRAFAETDQEQVCQIYRDTAAANPQLYYRPLSGPQLPDDITANFSHENDAFYVAVSDERVIGFCGIRTTPEDRTIGSFVNGTVIPEFRGQGVYKELFRIRETEAVKKGLKTFLPITSEHNTQMKDYLIRDGFELYTPPTPVPGFFHLKKVVK